MIFFFTGTGNSRWVAETVAASFEDRAIAMSDYFLSDGTVTKPVFTAAPKELIT